MQSFLIFTLFFNFLFAATPGRANDDIILAAADYPPFTIHNKDGMPTGVGVKVLEEIFRRLKIPFKGIQPFMEKLPEISKERLAVFPMVTRLPERESQFRWIGRLATDHYCFVTKKGKKLVNSIDEARTLGSVGVISGGTTEKMLTKEGFKNLDASKGSAGSVRKLFNNLIDAWLVTELVYPSAIRLEGFKPEDVQCGGKFSSREIWIAASMKTSDDMMTKLKTAFAELEKEGYIAKRLSEN